MINCKKVSLKTNLGDNGVSIISVKVCVSGITGWAGQNISCDFITIIIFDSFY